MTDTRGPTLAVIDDDPQICHLLRIALSRDGYQVHTWQQGEDSLDLLRKHLPDAIVLDLHMPGASGADILRHIQADRKLCRIPVIVATGETDPPELLGAFATVTKPFPLALLHSLVRKAIRCRSCD